MFRHIFAILLFLDLIFTTSAASNRVPVERRKDLCNTALFKTLLRTMYEVSPYSFNEKPFKQELWNIRNDICREIVKSNSSAPVISDVLQERCRRLCRDYSPCYSDFEWKCGKLWDLAFSQLQNDDSQIISNSSSNVRFLGVNRDAFVLNDFATGNAYRSLLTLAMKTRLPNSSGEASLLVAADHEALMSNILLVYRSSGEQRMHLIAHEYFLGINYPSYKDTNEEREQTDGVLVIPLEELLYSTEKTARETLQPRVCAWREAPWEDREPDELPVDVRAKVVTQVRLVFVGACVFYALLNVLFSK